MLAELLAGLADDPTRRVFAGGDAITRDEFADLVWTYAGALRTRGARSVALVGRPAPPTLALLLAGIGTGTRIDWIDPRAGDDLVRRRFEAAAPDVTIAEFGLAWPLKGPGWLRRLKGLPADDIWGEVLPIGGVGGAQQRRFAPDADAGALTLFPDGPAGSPIGVVHSVASLGAGVAAYARMLEGEGPVLTRDFAVMLACVALRRPIVRRAGRRPVTTLEDVYALPGILAVARLDGRGEGELVDGVEATIGDGGELWLTGAAMAPRSVDGDYLDHVATGRRADVDGRRIRLLGPVSPPAAP